MTSSAGLDQQAKAALKRLNADWKEIQANPISGVSAGPLESNIFEVCEIIFFRSLIRMCNENNRKCAV